MIGRLSTLGTYISHPFTNPGTDTSKDNNTSALVGAVGLVVLAGGTYYAVTTIQRSFVPANNANPKISQLKDTALTKSPSKDSLTEEMIKTNAAWNLPSDVKTTLDKLFVDSPYSIDTLPFYPVTSSTERKVMTAPIMKGTLNGHRFIVIKVDCDLSDEQTVKKCPLLKRVSLKHDRKIKETILLVQTYKNNLSKYRKKKFSWIQLNERNFLSPSFFDQNFISNKGSGPTPSQKDNFKLLQTLIKTGSGQDRNGLTWTISEE